MSVDASSRGSTRSVVRRGIDPGSGTTEQEGRFVNRDIAHRTDEFANPSLIARALKPSLGLCRNKAQNFFDRFFGFRLSQRGQQSWKNNHVSVTARRLSRLYPGHYRLSDHISCFRGLIWL